MTTYFTSDSHFNHANIAGKEVSKWPSGYRHFKTVEEMNKTLIDGINDTVGVEDELWHLGDWSFGHPSNIRYFRHKLKCQTVHLILGNHDKEIRKRQADYQSDGTFASINNLTEIAVEGQKIVLCHYAMRVWRGHHRGTIHLYGHSHGNLPPFGKSMDVGVDTNDFKPYSFEEIMQKLSKQQVQEIDHHGRDI